MTPDPRRQAIEAAKQAHFLRIAKGPTQAMEAAIDAYEAAMRPVGTLYHPPRTKCSC